MSIPSKGNIKPSAQAVAWPTIALVAGTWTATVTLVAPAPAVIVCGVIVIVAPAGAPLAESVTAAGNTVPVEGAIVK